jgi:hypothetical protein
MPIFNIGHREAGGEQLAELTWTDEKYLRITVRP